MRLRQTRQLTAIENVLRAAGRPLATIYRAVRELTVAGRIVSVQYAGQPARYEWAVSRSHSHFICNRCKRVFDIDEPATVPLPARRPKGFVFQGDEVIYYGLCADCHGRDGT
jgi:Fe2+ or Zn2+ uptake regulation protein